MPQIELCVLEKVEIAWQAGKGRREGGRRGRAVVVRRSGPGQRVKSKQKKLHSKFLFTSREREEKRQTDLWIVSENQVSF